MVSATQTKALRSTRASGPTVRKTAKASSTMTMGRDMKVFLSKVRDKARVLLTLATRRCSMRVSGIKVNNQVRVSTSTPQASLHMRDRGSRASSMARVKHSRNKVKRCIKAYLCSVCRHQPIITATENLNSINLGLGIHKLLVLLEQLFGLSV